MFGEASCVDRICPPSQRLPEECSEHGGKEGQAAQEGVRGQGGCGGKGVVGSSCCCWSQVGAEQVVAVRSHQSDAAASPVSSTAPLNLYLLLLPLLLLIITKTGSLAWPSHRWLEPSRCVVCHQYWGRGAGRRCACDDQQDT